MFCTSCGRQLHEGVRFCTECGSPVGVPSRVGARPAAPPPAPRRSARKAWLVVAVLSLITAGVALVVRHPESGARFAEWRHRLGLGGAAPGIIRLRVLESTTQSVSPDGGSITLRNGVAVVFPPGALDSTVQVTIAAIDPSSYFDGDTRHSVVVRGTAAITQFKRDVEIHVPLPEGFSAANAQDVLAGYVDEASGDVLVRPSRIAMIGGRPMVVFPTRHFSIIYIDVKVGPKFPAPPPYSTAPLVIPIYGQGDTPYCWAAVIQMLTQAAKFSADAEVTDIVPLDMFRLSPVTRQAGISKVGKTGIGPWEARFSLNIAEMFERRTGVRPYRLMWERYQTDGALNYLKRTVSNGYPVALFSRAWAHVGVVVGYSGDTLYVHDPRELKNEKTGYTPYPWRFFTDTLSYGDKLVLVDANAPLDPARPEVTVNITTKALLFSSPAFHGVEHPAYEAAQGFRFYWDYTVPEGRSIRHERSDDMLKNAIVTSLPGYTGTLNLDGERIQVVNASPTKTKSLTLRLEIESRGSHPTHYTSNQDLVMTPNSLRYLRLTDDDIDIDKFRSSNSKPTEYVLRASVLDGGRLADTHTLSFTLDPEKVTIEALDPPQGPVGTTVSIRGRGFGTVRGSTAEQAETKVNANGEVRIRYVGEANVVLFANASETPVHSWSDTLIVVDVPGGATTGDVIVRRGAVNSNPQTFTVPDTPTRPSVKPGSTWDTNLGPMTLTQRPLGEIDGPPGANIIGTIGRDSRIVAETKGNISSGSHIRGFIVTSSGIPINFEIWISADGNSFSGNQGMSSHPEFTGKRNR